MSNLKDRLDKDFASVYDDEKVKLAVTCMAAPTQIEGFAYGKYVYFRERYGHWGFWISPNEEALDKEPVLGAQCPEFMDTTDALALVRALIAIYVKEEE